MATCVSRLTPVVVFVSIASMVAFKWLGIDENNGTSICYAHSEFFVESADWDAENNRVLLSVFGGGIAEVRVNGSRNPGEILQAEKVVPWVKEAGSPSCMGILVDPPRYRVLAVLSHLSRNYSALAAYDSRSWELLFLKQLAGPESVSWADDVAVDDEGNAYVTDTAGSLIWKVSPDGSKSSVLTVLEATSWLPLQQARLNGIVYHPDGYLLVDHTWAGALFRVSLDGSSGHRVNVTGSILLADGLALLSPGKLVVASALGTKLLTSPDGWKTARVTHKYTGPLYRLGTGAFVKDGRPFTSFGLGFRFGKNHFCIQEAIFTAL